MKLVGAKEASKATGISLWSLKRGAKAGIYPHVMVGGHYKFDVASIEQALRDEMMRRTCKNQSTSA